MDFKLDDFELDFEDLVVVVPTNCSEDELLDSSLSARKLRHLEPVEFINYTWNCDKKPFCIHQVGALLNYRPPSVVVSEIKAASQSVCAQCHLQSVVLGLSDCLAVRTFQESFSCLAILLLDVDKQDVLQCLVSAVMKPE